MFPKEAAGNDPKAPKVVYNTTSCWAVTVPFIRQNDTKRLFEVPIFQLGAPTYTSRPRALEAPSQVADTTPDPDLALIPLREHIYWKPNLVSIPGERFPREITDFADKASSGEVWINCGMSGLQRGWLMEGTTMTRDTAPARSF